MTEERQLQLENIVKGLCEYVLAMSHDNRNTFMQRLVGILQEEYDEYFEEE